MSDFAELLALFHEKLSSVHPPKNALIPGAPVMTGSRGEALSLLWAREYLWQMDEKAAVKLKALWQSYACFWEERSMEVQSSPWHDSPWE